MISLNSDPRNYKWFIAGAIYGASALIKPHSIFFLPAIIAYIAYIFFQVGSLFSLRALYSATLFILSTLLIKFSVGYILAGSPGVTIFGPLYSSIATSSASDISRYTELVELALVSIKGHFFAVSLIYGMPAGIALSFVVIALFGKSTTPRPKESQRSKFERIAFLALAIILNLILVTGLFTASVANKGPYETSYRLHLRYYNFALPFFYIVAAGALSMGEGLYHRYLRYIIGGVIAASAGYAIYTNLGPFTPSFVDSPEVRGLHTNLIAYQIIGSLLILSIVVWIIFEKVGAKLYLYLALPLFVFTSSYYVALEQRNRLVPDVYDKAGIFTKQYLSKEDISNTLIVGSEPAGLFRSLFYLDNPSASLETISRDSDIDVSRIPYGKEWLLIIGDHALPDGKFFRLPMNGFTLARVSGSDVIDFKKSAWPGVISKVRGLSSVESWGTWSDSDTVVFKFATPLPEKFELHLVAHAFGPNVEGEFKAVVGSSMGKFKLPPSSGNQVLKFDNPGGTNTIEFIVPNPISPKDLGLSGDDRNLGIAFVEMKVVSLEESDTDAISNTQ